MLRFRQQARSRLRGVYRLLRSGRDVRLGPLSIVWTEQLADLRRRCLTKETAGQGRNGLPANPHSVVFLHNSYYNFLYLARALRERGWDAISVSLEDPEGPNAQYYHGEDLNLFDPDPDVFVGNCATLFEEVRHRFKMVHFYGVGRMSFFPTRFDYGQDHDVIPEDFLELRQMGIKIGHSSGGCKEGVAQSSFDNWSGACGRCILQLDPGACSDRRNLAWGHKLHMICDLIATEGNPALDYQGSDKCFREPLTTALDKNLWHPDLEIPEQFRLSREAGEILIYHAVGNYASRKDSERNLKGTPAVMAAVERLLSEGMKVRLEFRTKTPNIDLRYVQSQCDIIVDQLNHGRYGATAREGMMLGKPVICRLNPAEIDGAKRLDSINECPLVDAGEETVYDVLKNLVIDSGKRRRVGAASRAYAVKWHSAEACAERFEQVYDQLDW